MASSTDFQDSRSLYSSLRFPSPGSPWCPLSYWISGPPSGPDCYSLESRPTPPVRPLSPSPRPLSLPPRSVCSLAPPAPLQGSSLRTSNPPAWSGTPPRLSRSQSGVRFPAPHPCSPPRSLCSTPCPARCPHRSVFSLLAPPPPQMWSRLPRPLSLALAPPLTQPGYRPTPVFSPPPQVLRPPRAAPFVVRPRYPLRYNPPSGPSPRQAESPFPRQEPLRLSPTETTRGRGLPGAGVGVGRRELRGGRYLYCEPTPCAKP